MSCVTRPSSYRSPTDGPQGRYGKDCLGNLLAQQANSITAIPPGSFESAGGSCFSACVIPPREHESPAERRSPAVSLNVPMSKKQGPLLGAYDPLTAPPDSIDRNFHRTAREHFGFGTALALTDCQARVVEMKAAKIMAGSKKEGVRC